MSDEIIARRKEKAAEMTKEDTSKIPEVTGEPITERRLREAQEIKNQIARDKLVLEELERSMAEKGLEYDRLRRQLEENQQKYEKLLESQRLTQPEEGGIQIPDCEFPYSDGPGTVYRYWDWKNRVWRIAPTAEEARIAGNGKFEEVKVWFKAGKIDHILTREEVRKYMP